MNLNIVLFFLKLIAAIPVLYCTDKLIEIESKSFKKDCIRFVLAMLFMVSVCIAEMILIPI